MKKIEFTMKIDRKECKLTVSGEQTGSDLEFCSQIVGGAADYFMKYLRENGYWEYMSDIK